MIPARRGIVAGAIFLSPACDNSQRIIGKRTLQFECLRRVSQEPQVDFRGRGQNDGIAFG